MADYPISIDEVRKMLIDLRSSLGNERYISIGLSMALQRLDGFPQVDAVEVVRCRDCKHRNNPDVCHMIFMRGEMDWEKGAVSYTIDNYASDNDFCSKGEKRDGGTDNA